MALERLRGGWERVTSPLARRLTWVDPDILTWAGFWFAIGAAWLVWAAARDDAATLLLAAACMGASFLMDGLDGQVARERGTASPRGDFLDHTLDRVVDASLLIALGANTTWVPPLDFSLHLGWLAALATLMGSYMGTAAQSVGLERNYRGFSRVDRSVVLLLGVLAAAAQASIPIGELEGSLVSDSSPFWNGISIALCICIVGGCWTFLARFWKGLAELK